MAKSAAAASGLAPAFDVDLAWHTHMLRGADYEAESAAMCGGGALDHDNGEDVAGACLDAAWARTLDVWNDESDCLALVEAVPSGARRRGDLPPLWFGGGGDGVPPIPAQSTSPTLTSGVPGLIDATTSAREHSCAVVRDFLRARCSRVVPCLK